MNSPIKVQRFQTSTGSTSNSSSTSVTCGGNGGGGGAPWRWMTPTSSSVTNGQHSGGSGHNGTGSSPVTPQQQQMAFPQVGKLIWFKERVTTLMHSSLGYLEYILGLVRKP